MRKNVVSALLVLILAIITVRISRSLESIGVSVDANVSPQEQGTTQTPRQVPNPVGFQELSFDGEESTLACNGDGTQLGVVSGSLPSEFSLRGKNLQVWKLKSTLQPEKLLYRCPLRGSYSPDIAWVGEYLLFSMMENKTDEEIERELEKDLFSVSKFMHGYALSALSGNLIPFTPVQSEYLLPFSSHQVFVINSRQDAMSATKARSSGKITTHSLPARLYDIATNKTVKQFTLPMVTSGMAKDKHYVPRFLSKDGQYLVGSTSLDYPWKSKEISNNHLKYLVSIKLADGSAKSLTSEDAPDSLYLRSNQPFAIGLPCPVDDGKMVVCALNAYERNLNYRFQYYKPTGELVKEVKVNDRDMERAELPAAGEPITWTRSGDAILQIGSDIWFFDIKNWKGTKIAENLLVEEVHQWAGDRSVLVRVRKVIDKKTTEVKIRGQLTKVTEPLYSKDRYWGFLTLPELPEKK